MSVTLIRQSRQLVTLSAWHFEISVLSAGWFVCYIVLMLFHVPQG